LSYAASLCDLQDPTPTYSVNKQLLTDQRKDIEDWRLAAFQALLKDAFFCCNEELLE
jgi:hypothetical protein